MSMSSRQETARFAELGLGRGVDFTDPSPWANKSSFQIYPKFDDIIETDEGGLLQCYESRITSTLDIQAQLKASISFPNSPVSLGVTGELSRSPNSLKKVISRKVTNRTISFRMDSLSETELNPEVEKQSSRALAPSLEETVSTWIWYQICCRNTERKCEELRKKAATSLLHDYIQGANKDAVFAVVDDCADFVQSFRVTHYVNSVTLGASEHTVTAKSRHTKITREGTNVSLPHLASAQQKLTSQSMFSKSAMSTRMFGKIVDGRVERGSSNEVVIEVKVLPIYSLVRHNPFLFLALHKAILDYAEDRMIQPVAGPYVVECGDEGLYWKVDSNKLLGVTRNFNGASIFHIIPCDETDHTDNFSVGWEGLTLQDIMDQEKSLKTPASSKITRYLEVKTFCFGHFPGPLRFKSELSSRDYRLCLYDPIMDGYSDMPSPDIAPWTEKRKAFFISSAFRHSFVAVSRCCDMEQMEPAEDDACKYTAKCLGSRKGHNEEDTWMLFRLLLAHDYTGKLSAVERARKRLSKKLSDLIET